MHPIKNYMRGREGVLFSKRSQKQSQCTERKEILKHSWVLCDTNIEATKSCAGVAAVVPPHLP